MTLLQGQDGLLMELPTFLDSQRQTMGGRKVILMPTYRRGLVEVGYDSVACAPTTWADLLTEQGAAGPRWRRLEPLLVQMSAKAVQQLQTQVLDVSHAGRPTVARPRRGQPAWKDDRVAQLCDGIKVLVGQMAEISAPSKGQLRMFATRYAELREELNAVRAAVGQAESCFEVIQTQLIGYMGVQDD